MEDIVVYLFSLPSMETIRRLPREEIRKHLDAAKHDGGLELPKEYGFFLL